ncbi:YjfB family protein [Oceanobacillus halotolerans]|uniref:YjfB family protein n=1 Tax=Oceanobacillus halotolerans TaxID=2663380 RepID=UPI0013D90F4C|nr:YjfB family protein [Oceanobacillus halotolerans]
MDVAAMSMVMSTHQVRTDASLKVMDNIKDVAEQQSNQLLDMLEQNQAPEAAHPSLGNMIDVKA